jgi:prepilin-type N-terminal cleavage/methylation domain-containing protein
MIRFSQQSDTVRCPSPAGFTLVELMVVMVVLALLAALTLSGLAGVRDRAKADKTRSTIRKLHEIIVPHYESYLTRRVPQRPSSPASVWNTGVTPNRFAPSGSPITSSTSAATNRLWGLRLLMTLEMPDQWRDVAPTATLPSWAITAPVKRYAALKTAGTAPSTAYEGAECLAMIVLRGGFDPDLVELFRSDELGDLDGDRHPEFLDGWGKPIGFIRWPVGFQSPVQSQDAAVNPDPFDPMRRSNPEAFPSASQADYGVTPLIYSGGPSAALDASPSGSSATTPFYADYVAASDIPASASWVTTLTRPSATPLLDAGAVPSIRAITSGTLGPGSVKDIRAARDNITNFDFLTK